MAAVSKRTWTHKGAEKTAWIVRYLEGGRHRQKTFERKKDADAYRSKVESEMTAGRHVAASELRSVAACCEAFLALQEDRIRDGRIGRGQGVQYRNSVNNHIKPFFGSTLMADIKAADVEGFYRHLCRVSQLSPKTAKSRVAVFKQVFDFAVKRRMVIGNPVRDAMDDMRGIVAAPIRTFTLDETKALLTELHTKKFKGRARAHLYLQIAVHLAACCGLRYGEINGLTLGAIDLDKGLIRIRHNLTRWDELKGPKTKAGVRDVPLPRHIAEMIGAWLQAYYLPNDRELLFRTRTGGIIGTNSFHFGYWGPLLDRAGLNNGTERLHFHALRHFAASWMIENGWSLPEVATALGHSKFDTTLQVYAHTIIPQTQRLEAMQAMTDRLVTAPKPTPALALPAQ